MSKRSFIGIYLLLLLIAGLLSYIVYNHYLEVNKKVWPDDYASFFTFFNEHPSEMPLYDRKLSLDKPHMAEPYIAAWAAIAIADTMTYGYDNNNDRVRQVTKYYTDDGMKSLLSFRDGESGNMKRSERDKIIYVSEPVYASTLDKPYILISEGVVDGVYQWVFKITIRQVMRNPWSRGFGYPYRRVKVVRSAKHRWGMAIDGYIFGRQKDN